MSVDTSPKLHPEIQNGFPVRLLLTDENQNNPHRIVVEGFGLPYYTYKNEISTDFSLELPPDADKVVLSATEQTEYPGYFTASYQSEGIWFLVRVPMSSHIDGSPKKTVNIRNFQAHLKGTSSFQIFKRI